MFKLECHFHTSFFLCVFTSDASTLHSPLCSLFSLSLALSVAFTLHSSPVHPFILYLLTQSLSSPPLLWFCFCSASFQSFPLSIQRWDSSLSVSFSFLPPALSNKHRGASSEHCLLCQHTHTHKCIHTPTIYPIHCC